MFDGFMGREVRYKMGLKPWGSRSGNTIPAVIPLSYGFHISERKCLGISISV
jgi:hypothetical protein